MNQFRFIFLAATLFLLSCQSGTTDENRVEAVVEPVVNQIETDGPQKMVARLAIEGMGCEMACGGAIKKSLSGLDGVVLAEIEFDADKETDFAIVEFDDQKVSSLQMVETVNSLRKGHYKVTGVTIDHYVAPETAGEMNKDAVKSGGEPSATEKKIDTRSITFPNILDILNRLLI